MKKKLKGDQMTIDEQVVDYLMSDEAPCLCGSEEARKIASKIHSFYLFQIKKNLAISGLKELMLTEKEIEDLLNQERHTYGSGGETLEETKSFILAKSRKYVLW